MNLARPEIQIHYVRGTGRHETKPLQPNTNTTQRNTILQLNTNTSQ